MKMHVNINCGNRSNIRAWLLIAGVALLSSCVTPADRPGAQVEDRQVLKGQTKATTTSTQPSADSATPLDDRQTKIERAEYYQQLSEKGGTKTQSIDATLSSAEFYIQASDPQSAQQSITGLDTRAFTEQQRARYDIVQAYIEYARQEFRVALNRLRALLDRISAQSLEIERQKVDALLLSSFCYQSLDDYDSAIAVLVEREMFLTGSARAETSRYIWQVIGGLTVEQRQNVIQNTDNPIVRNRFEQSLQGQVSDTAALPSQFDQWRSPSGLESEQFVDGRWSLNAPKTIAVLLPISSRFRKAAQAVLDGIEYQHSLNTSIYKPRLDVYDIGTDPGQVDQFYATARASGAELIIGPLGKDYANQLTNSSLGTPDLPTILLGGDAELTSGTNRLTMSPEQQGRMVAERALGEGYVNAALLVPDNAEGLRTVNAFSQFWLDGGGKLSKSITYSPNQFDHSTELKQLFGINHSEFRHRTLSKLLGFKPKFNAYRRSDIDFVFMIANNATGRIVRPQINFFSGSKLPVLATSSVYNGIQDTINNVDLDRTSFPVMPWVLVSNDVAPYAGQLNMLFAMGCDAYSLAADLQRMRSNSALVLKGNMGTLNIATSGEIRYRPIWAKFKDGKAISETVLELTTPPVGIQNSRDGSQDVHSRPGNYNESNWDRRQSRRKTGS